MRAFQVLEPGENWKVGVVEIPDPTVANDTVLVRVDAAALNPIDYKIASGRRGGREYPLTLGFDLVGIVEEVGADVTQVRSGDRVMAMAPIEHAGTVAELVVLREENIAIAPAVLDNATAAALPLAALTALEALDIARVRKGQNVLIHAGAGGVGHFAIQLAKMRGATVYATASAANQELLAELGADHPVDYVKESTEDTAQHADVVIDTMGGDVAKVSLRAMRSGGAFVTIVGWAQLDQFERDDVSVDGFLVAPRGDKLTELASLVEAGTLRVIVHSVVPFDQAPQALVDLREGHTVGKRVVSIR